MLSDSRCNHSPHPKIQPPYCRAMHCPGPHTTARHANPPRQASKLAKPQRLPTNSKLRNPKSPLPTSLHQPHPLPQAPGHPYSLPPGLVCIGGHYLSVLQAPATGDHHVANAAGLHGEDEMGR